MAPVNCATKMPNSEEPPCDKSADKTFDTLTPKKNFKKSKVLENEQKTLRKSSSSKLSLFDTSENKKEKDFNSLELENEVAEFETVGANPSEANPAEADCNTRNQKHDSTEANEEPGRLMEDEARPTQVEEQEEGGQEDIQTYDHLGSFEEILHHVTSSEGQQEPPFFLFQPNTNEMTEERCLLPPTKVQRDYTLVLDLDETLIHFVENPNGNSQFLIRPYAQYFLKKMSKYYEIIVFTAAMQDYADYILDRMDTTNSISYRLYRRHTNLQNNVYHKDLSRIGRSLSRTLIVDNNAENFQLQPDNGIYIKSWYDDPKDTALKRLCPLLIGN